MHATGSALPSSDQASFTTLTDRPEKNSVQNSSWETFKTIYIDGLPNGSISGICQDGWDKKTTTNVEYIPEGYEDISDALDSPYIKVAITIVSIAALCLLAPNLLSYLSASLLTPIQGLLKTAKKHLASIPYIADLTMVGTPQVQLAASVATLALGTYFIPAVAAGCAVFMLQITSPFLILERVVILAIGSQLTNRDSDSGNNYIQKIKSSIFTTSILVPFLEEVMFRYILPYLYESACSLTGKLLSHLSGEDYTKDVDWFSRKTTVVFCSIIFGAAHFLNKHESSFAQALFAGWSAVRITHPVALEEGIEASIGQHMYNNAFSSALLMFIA